MSAHKAIVRQNIHILLGQLVVSFWLISTTMGVAAQNHTTQDRKDSIPVFGENGEALKNTGNWVTPTLTAAGYVSFTYLCYRNFDENIQKFSQRNQSKAASVMANGLTYAGLGRVQSTAFAGAAVTAFAVHNDQLKKSIVIWAASLLINSIATDELKKTFQRHRPNTGDPYNVFDWRGGPGLNKSFPSAHTSNAFTTATVFATMFEDKKWVPPIAYSLAAAVGLSRIYKNAHWASDVLTGAAVGFLSAKSMSALYKVAAHKFSILPEIGYKRYSISAAYRF